MKLIVFLCIALIASHHMVAAISKAEILALIQQDTGVDRVLKLLQAFRVSQNGDLDSLDQAYAVDEPALQAVIDAAQAVLDAKDAACAAIEDNVAKGRVQEGNLRDNIQAAQDTIASNNEKAAAAADARCAANLLFIAELANKQEAVDFLQYLRGKVADPSFADYLRNEAGAFLQIKAALGSKKEGEVLTLLAKHHMLSMLQKKSKQYEGEDDLASELTANVRSADEVGTDYIDNDRGALQVQDIDTSTLSVDDYIQKLLQYIDALVNQFQSDEQALQDAETKAVQAFIEYQQQLKDQNYVLDKYVTAASATLAALVAVDDSNEAAGQQCREEEVPLKDGRDSAQENHDSYVQKYNLTRANLVDTISLLAQVIQVYTDNVINVASDELKKRADDFLDNQVFDSTADFTARTSYE